MLRITASTSAAGARAYFDEELRKGDYYVKGHELAGLWHGKGAERLGLSGEVTRDQFHALTDNVHPCTGDQITPRVKEDRRVGYDFTFSAKKSVSILHAYTKDPKILDAFRESVRETMAEIEQHMETRVRIDGQSHDRKTGILAWAEFVHFNARPISGVADPHLHTHAYAFNVTYDSIEQRWKAGQFGSLKRDAPYFEAAFDARLAHKLVTLGYPIQRSPKGWEVAGLDRATIEKFSRRTVEIEATAKEKGITSAEQKSRLGAKTRKTKAAEIGEGYSDKAFYARLSRDEQAALNKIAIHDVAKPSHQPTASDAITHAVHHSFERQSVVPAKRLLAEALKHGVGSVTVEAVHHALAVCPDLLRQEMGGQTMTTTQQVLVEEKSMLAFARAGRGAVRPLADLKILFNNLDLADEQKQAVKHVLTSTDRVTAIRGGAGTGKTWLAKEAVDQITARGKSVVMLAPSANASRGVLRDDGFKDANTVARFLTDPTFQRSAKDGVIWVDEAGLMGVGTMNKILSVAQTLSARVVLVGDTRQHGAVERGDAMLILERHGGLKPSTLSQIRRQTVDWYRGIVEKIQNGNHAKAFGEMMTQGAIVEIDDRDARHQALAVEYGQAIKEGKTVMAVAPTHREADAVSDAIRNRLRDLKILGGEERTFTTQSNLNLTAAQKSDPASYETGQVVQFCQHVRGIKRGEKLTVVERTDKDGVIVEATSGKRHVLPLHTPDRFSVYRTQEIKIAVGDVLRITQNGLTQDKERLNNGAIYRVKGFAPDDGIVIDNKRGSVVPKDFANITHGYVTTSHASQGRTVDRTLIAQGAESLSASSAEQFYVSVSRGREGVKVFTDDADALRRAVGASRQRMAAVELLTPAVLAARERASLLQRLKTHARGLADRAWTKTRDLLAHHATKPTQSRKEHGCEQFGR